MTPSAAVLPGIDVWRARGFAPLAGKRVGLVTNTTGRDAAGSLTAEVLARSPEVELAALLTPEHGFEAVAEGPVADSTDPLTGLPIHSLYGDTRRPTSDMLAGLEGLVFDIQDVGTRIYTYATTLAYVLEAAAAASLPVVVLDRPNPITGTAVGGPVLDPSLFSFTGAARLALRHGMTLGELARWFNAEQGIGADLTVVPMEGWRRGMWYDETGLLWLDPSPNIRRLGQALTYPALGPLEWTNLSVGRGTDTPFEWFGAPWIDSRRLAAALNDAALPGIRFLPRRLTPASSVYAGQVCGGVDLLVTDRDRFAPARTAVAVMVTLRRLYPEHWDSKRLVDLWGDPAILEQLEAGRTVDEIVASWQEELREFEQRRQRYLLYE